jgi:hypothetical protein
MEKIEQSLFFWDEYLMVYFNNWKDVS